jgi:hypothetical protein
MSRLRAGEWLAGVGAAALLVTLFLPWFDVEFHFKTPVGDGIINMLNSTTDTGATSAWDGLGRLALVVALAAVACGAWLVIATVLGRPIAQLVAAAVLTATTATFAVVVLAVRVLVFQPGPDDIVVLRYGAYLGLLAALLLAVGGWWAIADERTDAPESAYEPPPPRPAPPPVSS